MASVVGTIVAGPHADTGDFVVLVEPEVGGWGANPSADGNVGQFCCLDGETFVTQAEVAEARFGLRVERFCLDPLGAGAGRMRGGPGCIREYRILRDGWIVTSTAGRHAFPVWGLHGGEDGTTNHVDVVKPDGTVTRFGKVARHPLGEGDLVRIVTATGGGYGPPTRARPRRPSPTTCGTGTSPSRRRARTTASRSTRPRTRSSGCPGGSTAGRRPLTHDRGARARSCAQRSLAGATSCSSSPPSSSGAPACSARKRMRRRHVAAGSERAGFAVERIQPDAAAALADPYAGYPALSYEGRSCVVGTSPGAGEGRSLHLSGHVDVVPVERPEEWTHDPWGGEIADGRLWGRGAGDMKGGLAAYLLAAAVVRRGLRRPPRRPRRQLGDRGGVRRQRHVVGAARTATARTRR